MEGRGYVRAHAFIMNVCVCKRGAVGSIMPEEGRRRRGERGVRQRGRGERVGASGTEQ